MAATQASMILGRGLRLPGTAQREAQALQTNPNRREYISPGNVARWTNSMKFDGTGKNRQAQSTSSSQSLAGSTIICAITAGISARVGSSILSNYRSSRGTCKCRDESPVVIAPNTSAVIRPAAAPPATPTTVLVSEDIWQPESIAAPRNATITILNFIIYPQCNGCDYLYGIAKSVFQLRA